MKKFFLVISALLIVTYSLFFYIKKYVKAPDIQSLKSQLLKISPHEKIEITDQDLPPKNEAEEKEFVDKLCFYFPQKKMENNQKQQLVSNLMQGATREGVYRSFSADIRFQQAMLDESRNLPSDRLKLIDSIRQVYLFHGTAPLSENLNFLRLQQQLIEEFMMEWEDLSSRDVALAQSWAMYLIKDLGRCSNGLPQHADKLKNRSADYWQSEITLKILNCFKQNH
jgi:hypothetical protein